MPNQARNLRYWQTCSARHVNSIPSADQAGGPVLVYVTVGCCALCTIVKQSACTCFDRVGLGDDSPLYKTSFHIIVVLLEGEAGTLCPGLLSLNFSTEVEPSRDIRNVGCFRT